MFYSDIFNTQRELDRIFNNDFWGRTTFARGSYPGINMFEMDDKLVLKAEVPGLKKQDLQIKLENDVISLTGEMKNSEKENIRYHRRERMFGTFNRSMKLPYRIDPEKVQAFLADGILTLTLEKDENSKTRTIEIQ